MKEMEEKMGKEVGVGKDGGGVSGGKEVGRGSRKNGEGGRQKKRSGRRKDEEKDVEGRR